MNPTLPISRRAADRLRSGHLWVYRTDLEPQPDTPEPGALVTIVDGRKIPLGTALYSTASQIAARIVSHSSALTREQYLKDVHQRLTHAIQRRRHTEEKPHLALLHRLAQQFPEKGIGIFGPVTNAQRLAFSEADDLPGIIIDRYSDLIILQLLTQGTAQDDVREAIVRTLRFEFSMNDEPLTVWERPDPRIRDLEQLPAPSTEALFTTAKEAPTTTTFTLNNLRFHYDAASGQKTGAFLDQRLNYAAAARTAAGSTWNKGKEGLRALDICTYQGGFALHLAEVCTRVTGIDASHTALEAADRNLDLNPHLATRCEVEWVEADAFEYLRYLDDLANTTTNGSSRPKSQRSRDAVERPASGSGTNPNRFDAIVLDPPAFAKSKRAAEGALRGYKELNLRALRLLNPGGTLITNSCSHHVSLEEFTAVIASAAADANRRVQLLETHAAAPDHPEILTLPETRYLKCLICRVD